MSPGTWTHTALAQQITFGPGARDLLAFVERDSEGVGAGEGAPVDPSVLAAAITAASNAGGSFSVVGDTTTTMKIGRAHV